MALNFCKRNISAIKKCSIIFNVQTMVENRIAQRDCISRLHTTSMIQSEPPSRGNAILGLRKQRLPPFPQLECIRTLDVETFLPSHYKIVKYGDYQFLESADGYVNVYTQAHIHPKNVNAQAGFAVYFGRNHPLNLHGAVLRRQHLNHAKMYSFLKTFEQIPTKLFTKLCICVDELGLITFIDNSLRNMSENSFRSVVTGKLNKDLETSVEINKVLRLRDDLTLRLKYIPNDIGVDGMYKATKLSEKAAAEATQQSVSAQRLDNE